MEILYFIDIVKLKLFFGDLGPKMKAYEYRLRLLLNSNS